MSLAKGVKFAVDGPGTIDADGSYHGARRERASSARW